MSRWMVLSLCFIAATVFAGKPDAREGGAAENPSSRNLIAVPAKAKRFALVIGNNSYPALLPDGQSYKPDLLQEGQLYNAVNDARLMEKELIALGFEVVRGENLSYSAMKAALRGFEKNIAGGGTGAFFFAGHGVMHGGRNYLIPSSIPKLDDLDVLRDEALEVNDLMARLVETKAEFSLLIIDACRNNPFKVADKEGRTRTLGAARGLAEIKPPDGIITIYSAGVGQEALDGPVGGNGLFTSEFVKELRKPGLHLAEVLHNVRDSVKKTAAKFKRLQTPAIYIQADKVYLNGIPMPVTPLDPEQVLWNAINDSNNVQDFLDYQSEYPKGKFVSTAKIKVRQLQKEEAERNKREADAAEKVRKEEEARQWREEEDRQRQAADRKVREAAERTRQEAQERIKRDQEAAEQARQEAERKAKAGFRDCPDCPEMVVIPAGRFTMGSPDNEKGRSKDEGPQHEVSVPSFALGKTEVTQAQWKAVMGSAPPELYFKDCGDDCPVESVSWNDAQEFIKKLNAKTGKTYRLPSEAEWEHACRAGGNHTYCGGDNPAAVAWYGAYSTPVGNSGKHTNPVAKKEANAFGLYDMSGNVWEWVEDCWNDNYSGAPTDGSAWKVGNCGRRVLRGGSWGLNPVNLRAADRNDYDAGIRGNYVGFRVARTLP